MPSHYTIIVNAESGGAKRLGADAIATLARTHLPGANLEMVNCADLTSRASAKMSAPILIGGGDGTLATAAQAMAPTPFGILPLGTMNLLARDLNIPNAPADALAAYAGTTTTRLIDAAEANGKLFLCSAVIGIVPESAQAREAARHEGSFPVSLSHWAAFATTLVRGLAGANQRRLTLAHDNGTLAADLAALVIACNAFSRDKEDERHYRRASLDGGHLAVYGIHANGAGDALRLLYKLWDGSWHEDDNVFSFATTHLHVMSEDGAATLPVSLDGETCDLSTPIEFTIRPAAVAITVPA